MKAGALFRLLLTGYGVALGGLCLVLSLLALVGQPSLQLGGEPVTGLRGLLEGLLTGAVLVLFTTVVNWLVLLAGLKTWDWISGLFRRDEAS